MQSEKCPQCNLVNFSGTQTCKRCGLSLTRQPIQNLTKSSKSGQREKVSTACPSCQCADTQSYNMAYQAGTSKGTVNVMSYNPDIGITNSGGTVSNQTMLAKQVSPPVAPDSSVEFVICIFLGGIILVISSIFLYSVIGWIGFLVGFIATAGIILGLYKLTEPSRQKKKISYEQNFAKWSRSWICLRCGSSWLI